MTDTSAALTVSPRQAREEDLPVLAVFERELARLNFPDDPITDLTYHEAKLRRALKAEAEGLIVLTTEDDEDIVGWLWLSGKKVLATGERYGVIRSLFVRHDLRRQGFASALVSYALRYFKSRGITRVVSKTHVNCEGAGRTLERGGFTALHVTYEHRAPATTEE